MEMNFNYKKIREGVNFSNLANLKNLPDANTKNLRNLNNALNKKNILPITVNQKRMHISREKSIDSPSTREFTLDSAKNIKNISPDIHIQTMNKSSLSRKSSNSKLHECREISANEFKEKDDSANIKNNIINSKVFNFNCTFSNGHQNKVGSEEGTFAEDEVQFITERTIKNANRGEKIKLFEKTSSQICNNSKAITNRIVNNINYNERTTRTIQNPGDNFMSNIERGEIHNPYAPKRENPKFSSKHEEFENYIITPNATYNTVTNVNSLHNNFSNKSNEHLLSPLRRLPSNPNISIKPNFEDKIQTERLNSDKCTNSIKTKTNFRSRINTDRGKSADNIEKLDKLEKHQIHQEKLNRFNSKQDLIKLNSDAKNFSVNNNKTRSESTRTKPDFRFKLDGANKPITPPDINTKKREFLPAISTNSKKVKKEDVAYDISTVFNEAKNFKEDPIVKKKMEDIIQHIDDIRTVINQKTKHRMKISSAPISHNNPKYSFKGISAFVNNDLNLVKNKIKSTVGDLKTNINLHLEKKLTLLPGNQKVPVKLKNFQ